VYALPRRPASRSADDARAVRGKALFESRAVGCSTCHNGPNLSSGASADIGRGEALQIPSLIAVSTRAPYMHDGCATTLLERFDPKCGGTEHGDSSSLTPSDLDDLVAYLETL
jgi:cytochrome c peroxidase